MFSILFFRKKYGYTSICRLSQIEWKIHSSQASSARSLLILITLGWFEASQSDAEKGCQDEPDTVLRVQKCGWRSYISWARLSQWYISMKHNTKTKHDNHSHNPHCRVPILLEFYMSNIKYDLHHVQISSPLSLMQVSVRLEVTWSLCLSFKFVLKVSWLFFNKTCFTGAVRCVKRASSGSGECGKFCSFFIPYLSSRHLTGAFAGADDPYDDPAPARGALRPVSRPVLSPTSSAVAILASPRFFTQRLWLRPNCWRKISSRSSFGWLHSDFQFCNN